MTIKRAILRTFPVRWQLGLRNFRRSFERDLAHAERRTFELLSRTVARKSDYYSPLPAESTLERNERRWNKPSAMAGVSFDIDLYKRRLSQLLDKYSGELGALPPYTEIASMGFGPGYPEFDAFLLYMTLRETKPRRYLEVGSGMSTLYCSLAAAKNSGEGHPLGIRCIEPFPYKQLRTIQGIDIVQKEVQDVAIDLFQQLEENDVLFIDSSHILRIDGDVPFLFLEVLPRIRKGVRIHIHDVPFPYNTPHPADLWVLGKCDTSPRWPVYWNEAMVVQAFLAFNSAFEIEMSTPMIRKFDEPFLAANVPHYKSVQAEPNTFSSIWIRKSA